ncbi:type IV pilin protein [Thalassotalea ponticola]|uniref:type IV pilin protein n=1 Tax=Thalassotalea ponticola TaxID=1523392 RepID=UPI0025B2F883|nr:type IV pilin protein [Thalassotalea ponticola]MDN3653967.1 type IV pilin protein [Thalassotalea ponticola]
MGHKGGFTLIELMVVVAIVGILASIALPSYSEYVTRTNRTEAHRELIRIANLQEQYYVDHRKYTASLSSLGLSADSYVTENNLYQIDATVANGGFTLTAVPLGSQQSRDTQCQSLAITDTGKRLASSPQCWEN